MRATDSTQSQTERCLRELRTRIVAGAFEGGARLREVPLSEALQVSRTPLRAALLRLEQEGLLETGKGGYTVRRFSLDDALLAIELRGVLEGTAARIAAEQGVAEAKLAFLQRILDKLDEVLKTKAFEAYPTLNDSFHDRLSALCSSEFLKREIQRANALPFAAPSAFSSTEADAERFNNSLHVGQHQHHALLQAIRLGQGSRAEALAREHAQLARTNIELAYQERQTQHRDAPQLALVETP